MPAVPYCSTAFFTIFADFMKPIASIQKQQQLLKQELAYDRKTFEDNFKASIQHSYNNSNCWFPIRVGNSYYNALNQFVVEIECRKICHQSGL